MILKKKGLQFICSLPTVFAFSVGAALLLEPHSAVEGMKKGIEMCAGVVVPSLFPFMVVSTFAALTPRSGALSKVPGRLMQLLFRLPPSALTAVVFGMLGGFPVGCSTAAQLCEQGRLTREQAQRCTLFCVNAGPAFVMTAVGTVLLGNRKTGLLLFVSLCLSALIIGFFLRFTAHEETKNEEKKQAIAEMKPSAALVAATEKGAFATIKICAWVTLFSCLISIIFSADLPKAAMTVISCVLEVTNGCLAAAGGGNIFVIAAALGWSGLCVFCQVLENLRKVGTSTAVFLAFRALNAALTAVICRALMQLFPVEHSAFSNFGGQAAANGFSVSVPASLALLCLCAVFIIDLDRSRKMC